FCLTLQRTQTAVRPRNRLIAPGLVWLHLLHLGGIIPFLGIVIGIGASVWDLIMVLKLGGSLQREFEYRGWRTNGEGFGKPVGLVWTIGQLATLPLALIFNLVGGQLGNPSVAMAVGLVMMGLGLVLFVCWIVYWVQMAGYGKRLREGYRGYGAGGIEDDYDDEYMDRRGREGGDDFDFYRPRPRRDQDEENRPPRPGRGGRGDGERGFDRPRP